MADTPAIQRLFAELKRRHVFRVMAVYGVVGFVILQVVDLLVPALLLPDWTYRLVALLLLIGFPIAVIMAWAFELTADGVQRTQAASDEEIRRSVQAPASSRWPVGLAALGGVVLLGAGTWWVLRSPADAERTYDSIAVLPFTNLTGDEEAEYLGDGIAEELLNALAGIADLKVASRTGAFAFKNASIDPTEIADSLGVALVLEGSVRGAGDRLRITAQLIDGADGYHLWSEQYDRPRSDLLDLQEELTGKIVDELAVQLGTGDIVQLANLGTTDPEAYDLYLKGRHFWNKRRPDDMSVAIGLFEEAIAIDSTYAPAYAAIAETHAVPVAWELGGAASALDEAERYAGLALDLDPTLAQAHSALGMTYMMRDLDFRRAEDSFARAIELDPGYATAHQWFAELLSAVDRHDEAVAEVRRAESLDPTPIIVWNVSRVLYFAGRYEEAIEQLGGVDGARPETRDVGTIMQSLYALGDFERIVEMIDRNAPPEFRSRVEPLRGALRTASDDERRRMLIQLFTAPSPDEEEDSRGPTFLANAYWPAVLWLPVEPDSAIVPFERLVSDSVSVDARIEWFHVLADATFDVVREDPRYLDIDARMRR